MQKIPLKERVHPIEQELNILFAAGADLNVCQMVNGETETPLMVAVCACDYYMVEYLLEHGANPKVRLFEETPEYSTEHWLLEEMDVQIMNDASQEEAEAAAGIAQLLWEHRLKGWSGLCIDIDARQGVKDIHSLKLRY